MLPIGSVDLSSIFGNNPEKLPTAGGAGGIDPSNLMQSLQGTTPATAPDAAGAASGASAVGGVSGATGPSFANVLENAVQEVNTKMQAADVAKQQVLTGETSNVHQSMIAVQEASVAFSLMVEVRNKLTDSYQELIRMQV
jgi:flagellar hook-basal body complex protein FliE